MSAATLEQTDLTAVSLFAGVGGIDLAMERNGINVTAAVEIDKAARGVLADQFPNTTLFNDVTEVTGAQLLATGFVPERGIITAGFPCQDLSVAGRRKGMGQGTRSGLYWHIVRLATELRPRWIVLENVPGILSATCPCAGDSSCVRAGRALRCDGELHAVANGGACIGGCIPTHGGVLGAVIGSLVELGYGVAYRVLDAQFFGVPQRRRRFILVGCLGDPARPVEVLLEPEGRQGDPTESIETGPGAASSSGYGFAIAGEQGGVANMLLARDAKGPLLDRSIGNVVIDSTGESMPTLTASYGEQTHQDYDTAAASAALPVHEVVSILQGGGKRGYRVDAEGAGGGHLIVCPPDGGGCVDQ